MSSIYVKNGSVRIQYFHARVNEPQLEASSLFQIRFELQVDKVRANQHTSIVDAEGQADHYVKSQHTTPSSVSLQVPTPHVLCQAHVVRDLDYLR